MTTGISNEQREQLGELIPPHIDIFLQEEQKTSWKKDAVIRVWNKRYGFVNYPHCRYTKLCDGEWKCTHKKRKWKNCDTHTLVTISINDNLFKYNTGTDCPIAETPEE